MRFDGYLLLAVLLVSATHASAQQGTADSLKTPEQKISATPVKSNISYKTLSQFFQTSVTSGANGGFDFKSSWWGIKKLFNGDAYDQYYSKETGKFQRNFEVSVGVHKTSAGTFSMITAGIKYSPINKRSKSDVNFFNEPVYHKALINRHDVMVEANDLYRQQYVDGLKDPGEQNKARAAINAAQAKYDTTHDYNDLPKNFNDIRENLIKKEFNTTDYATFSKAPELTYHDLAKRVDMGSLLTFSFNPGYDYNHQNLDSTSFNITYLVGFGPNANKPYNLDVQGSGLVFRDTLLTGHNTSRHELTFKLGLNKTLVTDDKSNPLIEFELQGEYDDHLNTPLYKNEENRMETANAVLTVHFSSTLALPVTLKYDLKKPNLLGILNLTWNFENSKSGPSN